MSCLYYSSPTVCVKISDDCDIRLSFSGRSCFAKLITITIIYLGTEFECTVSKHSNKVTGKDIDMYTSSSLLQAYLNKHKVPMKADIVQLELERLDNILYDYYATDIACEYRFYKHYYECAMAFIWFTPVAIAIAKKSQPSNETLVV